MSFTRNILNDMKSKRTRREWIEFWLCFSLNAISMEKMKGFEYEIKEEINLLLSEYSDLYHI